MRRTDDRDEQEFGQYVAARAGALRRTAFLLCGDWHLAEDLVQTTFTKLFLAWRRVQRRDALDGYVRQILVRAYIDDRRLGRHREAPTAELPDRAGADGGSTEQRLEVLAALSRVPPRQRAAIVLRYWEDLPVAEVAALLKCSEGTVKSQTARGLETLRSALGTTTPALTTGSQS